MSLSLAHTLLNTSLGEMRLLCSDENLYWLSFADSEPAFHYFIRKHAIQYSTQKTAFTHRCEQAIHTYFKGELTNFNIPCQPLGTAFQQRVWQALQDIPYGNTISYKTLAKNIGHPKAVRAVALANAANPISILIPCHRVIQHNGNLGGYSGGLPQKIGLLKQEGVF